MTERARPTGGSLQRIRAVGEHGLTRSAEALSRMLGCRVRLALTGVYGPPFFPIRPWPEGVERRSTVLLRVAVGGGGRGSVLVLLRRRALHGVLQALLGTTGEPHDLTEIDRSAVHEFGNVLASSFLSELGDRLGRRLLPSPPDLVVGDLAARVHEVLAWVHTLDSRAWVMQADLAAPERGIEGQVLIVLDDAALAPATGGAPDARRVCT